jgi:hypothetical protein
MGGLIPTKIDSEISAALNARFSETNDPIADAANPTKTMIGSVRWHHFHHHEHLFDARGLHRVAYRLINNVPADPDRRKAWYFLLRHPTSPDALSAKNRQDIKDALNQAMNDTTIRQVKFAADHKNVPTRFQIEATVSDELSTADKITKIKTLTITIHCQLDQLIPPAPAEVDPPPADVPEQPPVQIP